MSIRHILSKEFDSERDREWHCHIWNCPSLSRFISAYFFNHKQYYDTYYEQQRELGIYNKLDFLISQFLHKKLCEDDTMESLISKKLNERLQ